MTDDDPQPPAADGIKPTKKRPYVPPKLEKLGTIRDLTRGAGQNNKFDGGHPPGHNKSIL
jgi:hypothetical protein